MSIEEAKEIVKYLADALYKVDQYGVRSVYINSTGEVAHALHIAYGRLYADLRENVHGEWLILGDCANEGVYCSKCHKKVFKYDFSNTMKWKNFKYCPNYGSDNRGEKDERFN